MEVYEGARLPARRIPVATVGVLRIVLRLLHLPLLLDEEAVQILDNVLVLPGLGQVFHLLQNLLQILSWSYRDLLQSKQTVVEFVFSFEDSTKVSSPDNFQNVECFAQTVQSNGSVIVGPDCCFVRLAVFR